MILVFTMQEIENMTNPKGNDAWLKTLCITRLKLRHNIHPIDSMIGIQTRNLNRDTVDVDIRYDPWYWTGRHD